MAKTLTLIRNLYYLCKRIFNSKVTHTTVNYYNFIQKLNYFSAFKYYGINTSINISEFNSNISNYNYHKRISIYLDGL